MAIVRAPGRRSAAVLAGVLVLAACGADGPDRAGSPEATDADAFDGSAGPGASTTPGDADQVVPITVTQIPSSPPAVGVSGLSALQTGVEQGLPEPLVPLEEIRSGGPPPDGIPPIDTPTFIAPHEVRFLGETEPVLAIEIEGDARAYPVQILMWHEIVNDTIGGVPVSVSYCPLCNSAVAYDRRVGDLVVDFGTSGSLWNSALVMYDRQTETLWSHFTATGIVGELTGVELGTFPVATVPWGVWRDANPDGLVLSRETGFERDYGRNPYPGYDDLTARPFLFEGEVDGTFTAMTRVVGIERDGDALAVPLFRLQEDRVVHASVGGADLVVFWQPGSASALDHPAIASGEDIGATGVFSTEVDGEAMTFRPAGSASGDAAGDDDAAAGFVDDATGSTWDLLGRAVDGPLRGARLERVEHLDTFWFAWSVFRPDSALVDDPTDG